MPTPKTRGPYKLYRYITPEGLPVAGLMVLFDDVLHPLEVDEPSEAPQMAFELYSISGNDIDQSRIHLVRAPRAPRKKASVSFEPEKQVRPIATIDRELGQLYATRDGIAFRIQELLWERAGRVAPTQKYCIACGENLVTDESATLCSRCCPGQGNHFGRMLKKIKAKSGRED